MKKLKFWGPLLILLPWAAFALLGQALPLNPNQISLEHILSGSMEETWLGYDDLGRPLADRLIIGAQTSFFVSMIVVSLSFMVGGLIGMTSGYVGGLFDHTISRIMDIFLAFPGMLLAIALAGMMGPGIGNVVIALTIVGWVGYARLARAQVLSLKERDHIMAAMAVGTSTFRILTQHIAPLVMAPLMIEASFGIAGVIIGEAGLSFLGLGIQPPSASWGSMIRDGTRYMLVAPHMVIIPGVTLMLVVLSINLFGDWLRDWLVVKGKVQ